MMDVETALGHHRFMVRNHARRGGLVGRERRYYALTRSLVVLELRLMAAGCMPPSCFSVYNGILCAYMRSQDLREFVLEVFSDRSMLTETVVSLAWNTGNAAIIQKCLELGVDVQASRNVAGAIRSDDPGLLDVCVANGASLGPPLRPFRSCRSVSMMTHLARNHRCRLHDLSRKMNGDHRLSVEYVRLGGYIEEMGEDLNRGLQAEGNRERALPIKLAFVRSRGRKQEAPPVVAPGSGDDGRLLGGLLLLLPGAVVEIVTSFV